MGGNGLATIRYFFLPTQTKRRFQSAFKWRWCSHFGNSVRKLLTCSVHWYWAMMKYGNEKNKTEGIKEKKKTNKKKSAKLAMDAPLTCYCAPSSSPIEISFRIGDICLSDIRDFPRRCRNDIKKNKNRNKKEQKKKKKKRLRPPKHASYICRYRCHNHGLTSKIAY